MSKLSSVDENIAYGARLAAIREAMQLTQQEFATQLGLSYRAYANYERGEREMPTSLFKALVENLSLDPFWLLTGPAKKVQYLDSRRGSLDAALLEAIVALVESWLFQNKRTLKPDKKARVIRLAYEHCVELGQIDACHLNEILTIAA